MEELHFLEKKHIYLLDGEPIPCVSDLCRFLHREVYKRVYHHTLRITDSGGNFNYV